MKRAEWLARVLRDAGCTVVEHEGWKGRGRDFTDLGFVTWHHDASPPGDSPGVPAYMLAEMAAGRAAAQLWVDRRGTWHVLAAGVAFHAGNVLPGKPGNTTSLGVETDHTIGEPWPTAQLVSLRRGTAAILRHLGRGAASLEFHKTVCSPAGRKTDPDGLGLLNERAHVAALLTAEDDMAQVPQDQWEQLRADVGAIRYLLDPPGGEAQGEVLTRLRDSHALLAALHGQDAKAVALAIPDTLAAQVADELARRLGG